MINLYKKDETTFEHNGLGSLDKNILNPEISWKDNGAFTLEFKYPLFAKHGFEIENSSIVRANDPEGSNLFFVYKITPSMGYVNVLCYQISYKLAFNSINDTNIVNKNGQNALNQMGNSTQYPHSFTFSSDIQTTATSRVVRKNPIEFLLDTGLDNSFVNRWGGHIVRHNFNISMNSAYGSNKGYTIRHKKDLKGYEAEFDESVVITRVRPVGYDGLLLPEIYVDSELIEAYTEPRIQQIEYSNVKVKTKDSDEEGFSTKELAYAELRRLANLEFSENKVDQPDFSAKVEFVNLKDTQEYKDLKSLKQILPGDIVKVVHSEDNFSIEAQMVEYKYNPLNNSYISITLGNYTKSFTSTVGKSLQTNLNQVAQQAQSAMNTANGKNTVYSLTHKPSITNSSVEGDLLYLKNGDKTELWILKLVNGKLQWVLQVSDATSEELKAQMQQAQTEATEAKTAAQDAVDKANASVTAVQANTQLINDVNTVANNAKSQAQTATTNAQTALTSANTAMTNANKAIGDVGKLSEDVSTLNTIANQAKSDADTALINANKGITDAKTALNKAIGVDTRVTTEITNVNNTLATKANSTTVDALSKTVSSQGTAISQNATDIKLKADSTVVNAIKGMVDNQGTLISQNSKDIALKANKTSVDTLTGRVSANETAIDVTAQGVSTLVTKTDNTNTSLSQFKQDYEGFKGTVYAKGQTDTKVSTVQQSVDNFKTTVSNTYSSKSETDSKVTAVQANVDKLGTNIAYAWSQDGKDRFTRVKPNENIITQSPSGASLTSTTTNNTDFFDLFKISQNYQKLSNWTTLNEVFTIGFSWESSTDLPDGASIGMFFAKAPWAWNFGSTNNVSGRKGSISKTGNNSGDLYNSIQTAMTIRLTNIPVGTIITITKVFVIAGNGQSFVPSLQDDYDKAVPRYIGRSLKDSNSSSDYKWEPNPERKPWTAYANSADGTDGFTTVYPNLNLGDNTKTFVGAEGGNNLSGSIRIDPATQKTQDGDFNYLTYKRTTGNADWFKFFLIPEIATPNMTKVAVKPNTKYTFSVWLKGTGQHTIYAYKNWTSQGSGQTINLTSNWTLYTFTVTSLNVIPAENVQFFIRSNAGTEINLKYPKVEEGSIATLWTPAPSEDPLGVIPKYVGTAALPYEDPYKYEWRLSSDWNQVKTSTEFEQTDKEIALKANQADVNTITGRVSTAEGSISTMAGQIKLKANQTDVDTLTGRVTSAEGSISTMAGQIVLKANQADVNTITDKVNAVESSITVQSGQITALNTKTDGQTTQIGSLQSSYNGLTSTIASVKSDLDNMVIGGTNILATTTEEKSFKGNGAENQWGILSQLTKSKLADYGLKVGDKVTFSATCEISGSGFSGLMRPRLRTSWVDIQPQQITKAEKIRYNTTITMNESRLDGGFGIDFRADNVPSTVNMKWSNLKLEIGDKATYYSPAPEEKASQIQVTQMAQDLDGFKTTVANTYTDKSTVASQINQSATQVTSNVQSWTNNKLTAYSTTQQTATSITNAVASKADKSQITQLSNQITSVVTDVSAIQVGGQNLLLGTATAKTYTITQTDNYTAVDPYNFSVSKFSAFNFEVDDYITLSFDWETTSTTGDIRPEINSTPYGFGTVISAKGTNGVTSITKTITASEQRGRIEIVFKVSSTVKVSEASKLRLRFDNHQLSSTFTIKNAKLEKGNKATDWCIAPQEVASQSQITQLSDNINLRVSKGDVTSQINIEAGRTLIDTKQLLLNADNVKFSGSAFIPNAMIKNLSADKITAGTLNAANVNVINLNAKSLTAGTISGTNLSMNLDTGSVQFTKGYISGNNNKIRFDLDNSYLHSINTNGSGFQITNGQFSFFNGLLSSTPQYLGAIMLDFFSTDKSGIKVYGNKGASIQGGNSTISVGYSLLGDNKIGLSGDTGVTGGLSVLGKLSVLGSKNAIHVTRDGIRATPAYETAESYLGDIGGNYTRENCEVWVDIDELFSDTVNTDIAYHVFLQAYDDARFWVEDFRSDKFLIKSDKPMARFAWELKAKRRGYENDRLVVQEGFDNKMLDKVHDEGGVLIKKGA